MGRAGRVAAGTYFALFTSERWSRMGAATTPEMCRASLDQLCLTVHQLGLGKPEEVLQKCLSPPAPQLIHAAVRHLREINALSDGSVASPYAERILAGRTMDATTFQLTPLGQQLTRLPTDVIIGKLLLMGCIFGVVEEVLIMAAILTVRQPFRISLTSRDISDKVKQQLGGQCESDHFVSLRVMELWDGLKRRQKASSESFGKRCQQQKAFCDQYCLDHGILTKIDTMRENFRDVLRDNGLLGFKLMEAKPDGLPDSVPTIGNPVLVENLRLDARDGRTLEEFYRRRRVLLRAVLCSALWPQVVAKTPSTRKQEYEPATFFSPFPGLETTGAHPHPSSVCSGLTNREVRHPLFVYQAKMVSSRGGNSLLYLQNLTGVSMRAALLLGGKIATDLDAGVVTIDDWMTVETSATDAAFVRALRHALEQALWRVTTQPFDSAAAAAAASLESERILIIALTRILVFGN